MAKAVKNKSVRPFWAKVVETYFSFCMDKFGENPSFDGASPRDLGMLMDAIQKKAEEKQMVWTEELAVKSLSVFLEFSFKDRWLQDNFLLFNLNRQKDKIFFNIKSAMNGNASTTLPANGGNNKTNGQHIFAERLRGRIERLGQR